ncbi:MAG: YggS family pyridoxal phosphate-dependent enzyme [Gemmatimonadota bacterium]
MPIARLAERWARTRDAVALACRAAGRDPGAVRIVAITKGHPVATLRAAVDAGVTDIGENRVQEARAKFGSIGGPAVTRHLVGHLQRNKVRDALELFDWIQALDSLRIADALAARAGARAAGVPVPVLIEVNAGAEPQKFGFTVDAAVDAGLEIAALPGLSLRGVMTVAPWSDDEAVVRRAFVATRRVFEDLAARLPGSPIDTLSMGMSGDYPHAIAEGATMIRLGTALFGARDEIPTLTGGQP